MFEEGFKRYNNAVIIKVFGESSTHEASITYMVADSTMPRFALVREPTLESYTTVSEDCMGTILHKSTGKYGEFTEEILKEFAIALKNGLPVNLVIAILKKGRNIEFVAKAEFL